MAKFCGKCGSILNEQTGKCPKCNKVTKTDTAGLNNGHTVANQAAQPVDTNKKLSKKEIRAAKRAAMPTGKKIGRFFLKLLLLVLVLSVLATGIIGALQYYDIIDIPAMEKMLSLIGLEKKEDEVAADSNAQQDTVAPSDTVTEEDESDTTEETDNTDTTGSFKVTPPDADQYFQNNSTVVSDLDINDSSVIRSESDVYDDFYDRGFTSPITTEYSMEGEYFQAVDISSYSSDKHPVYETYYVDASGEIWIISEVNAAITASPVYYNAQTASGVPVIISESDTVTSYDSTTNKFYQTVPNESVLIVKTVERIDAETLETLSQGAIDEL